MFILFDPLDPLDYDLHIVIARFATFLEPLYFIACLEESQDHLKVTYLESLFWDKLQEVHTLVEVELLN